MTTKRSGVPVFTDDRNSGLSMREWLFTNLVVTLAEKHTGTEYVIATAKEMTDQACGVINEMNKD